MCACGLFVGTLDDTSLWLNHDCPFDRPPPPFLYVKQVVLAPIAIGMVTNKYFPMFVEKILPFAPVVGVVSTCLLVASAVAQVAEPILNAGLSLQVRPNHIHLFAPTKNIFVWECLLTEIFF